MRVYVPVSAVALSDLVASTRLPGPLAAHGVTAALRDAWPEADAEEAEYAALMAAAAGSRDADGRRRVVAVDATSVRELADEADPTLVELDHGVSWAQLAAAHVDLQGGAGDDEDLAWFATQEIADLA